MNHAILGWFVLISSNYVNKNNQQSCFLHFIRTSVTICELGTLLLSVFFISSVDLFCRYQT